MDCELSTQELGDSVLSQPDTSVLLDHGFQSRLAINDFVIVVYIAS